MKKKICKGYTGYKCNVVVYGKFNLCSSCKKIRRRDQSNQRSEFRAKKTAKKIMEKLGITPEEVRQKNQEMPPITTPKNFVRI